MTDDTIRPLRTQRLPLTVRAQQYLLRLIQDGTYRPGEQLPSQGDLASRLGISRPTLREALLNLEREGLIVRRHGVGTFVAPWAGERLESGLERLESILDLAARRGLEPAFSDLEVSRPPADEQLAAALRLEPGTPVTRIRRVILLDGAPVAYMDDSVPASILTPEGVDGTFTGSVLDLLRRKDDLHIGQAVAEITPVSADEALSARLAVPPGQPLLLLEETLYDEAGTPLGWSRNFLVAEHFRFHVVRR